MRSLRPALALATVALATVALAGMALAASAAPASAQRRVEIHFTPTIRAQVAVWVESADGTQFRTLGLTEAVSYRGIANRPGALQMNSGFHWPYGRREGVLPPPPGLSVRYPSSTCCAYMSRYFANTRDSASSGSPVDSLAHCARLRR